jgi:hypothetical protein
MTREASSVWRSALGRASLGWMTLCVVLVLGLGPLGELLPNAPVVLAVLYVVMLPALPLLAWAAAAPKRTWPAVAALVVFCAAFVLGFTTLLSAGARMYFLARQATYERIIAEGRGGRLPVGDQGGMTGRRYGASYFVNPTGRPLAQFSWGRVDGGFFGVMYDALECLDPGPPSPSPPPQPRAEGEAEPPTMKNAGQIGPHWRLSDEACLIFFTW